ncbi:MAG: ferredoxin family protein [Rickettsiaceae bacterium]|nr:ferredoxin family protein [Rickettsiaceae bacterium]
MTHVVTEACIKCKYTDCVEVCPVQCFYEGELMLVIDPETCIDCGVCVAECPIDAISEEKEEHLDLILQARRFSSIWPNIRKRKPPLKDADKYKDEKNKLTKYANEIK